MLGRVCRLLARSEAGPLEGPLSAAARSLGAASTSYGAPDDVFTQALQRRHMAKKAKKSTSPAPVSLDGVTLTPASQVQHPEHLARLQKLKMRRRTADHIPLQFDESQRGLIKQVAAASKAAEAQAAEAAIQAGQEPPEAPESGASGLKQIGPPLSQRDVVKLVHKSLSGAAEQQVHFRPYVFTNLFQSAPAIASYVANALESGTPWARVERFFLSSVEADRGIGAIKVQVKGRLGRKATMASTKVWEHGQLHLYNPCFAVDHGMATAMTRVGILGIQVWVRYVDEAIANSMYHRKTGMSRPLIQLLAAKRKPLPYRSPAAWWNTPAPEQPALNRTWQAFDASYSPTKTPVTQYLESMKPKVFRHAEDRRMALHAEMDKLNAGAGQPAPQGVTAS